MTYPRITYNLKNVDFLGSPNEFQVDYNPPRNQGRSRSGHTETIITPRVDVRVSVLYRYITDTDLTRQLHQWFAWAINGNAWTYAHDSSEVVNTSLNGAVSAGASSVVVTSASGITAGKKYYIADGSNYQVVKVLSVVSTTITFATIDTLNFAFASGSIFRSELYWSGILIGDSEFPITDIGKPANFVSLKLVFAEDLN